MRKLYQFLAGILAIIFFLWGISAYMQSRTGNVSDKLVIYNWGDYIDPDLLTKFTKETGIKVQYETFDSNEAMYTKIKQGGTTYDIAVPSDYTIDKMVKEDLLVKLDKSKIHGFDQIGSSFKGLSFDPNNDYSIHKTSIIDTVSIVSLIGNDTIDKYLYQFKKISVDSIIPWATDKKNPYSETFIIGNNKIKFIQGLRALDYKSNERHYTINDNTIKISRILIDSLPVDFDKIAIDYGENAEVYQKDNLILFVNQPMGWNGLSNSYRLIQIVDTKSYVCYECLINYSNIMSIVH